jgi:ABC-type phosphate/phosphonate transport system ATPase subunit
MLVAVVGPSGAGKDTLMEAARLRLEGRPGFRFARRVITRPADAGGEEHEALDRAAFLARQASLPAGLRVARVMNDGTVEAGVAQVLAALGASDQVPGIG